MRYAAFLRGVMPTNAKMPELKRAFEAGGFTNVKTVLSSGNVVFDARAAKSIERTAEAAMEKHLGRSFPAFVRSVALLQTMCESDPYRPFRLPSAAKRVVTFLRTPPRSRLELPVELHGAKVLRIEGLDVFSAYLPGPEGPVFMQLIEKTFGKDVTTRTFDTVRKVAAS